MYTKNTKIVCTLGPSSDSVTEITKLVSAGMNVARLNFSHGSHENHLQIINNLRKVEKITGKRIGILQDLQGPKIRLGEMPEEGIDIKTGDKITLTISKIKGFKKGKTVVLPVQYKGITKDVKKKDAILINDGLIELRAEKVSKTEILCRVKNGGHVIRHNGVNLPTSKISVDTITHQDKEDLKFGLKNGVDFVALSFVKNARDINSLRALIQKEKKEAQIIAKIERHEAVKNLKEIIKATDGVMVARGDLGIDIPAELVPIIQKRIIALSNRYGKPVITATQVLQSMVESPRATRAEISDAANAVFDHTDALMLSNESAVGKYPFKAAQTLTKVASTVEDELKKHEELLERFSFPKTLSTVSATCLNACELAMNTKADFIVVYTTEGYTAKQIAKHRIYIPIITLTPNEKTARLLTLVWGINKVYKVAIKSKKEKRVTEIIQFLRKEKIAKKGQKIVIVGSANSEEKIISTIKL